MKKSFVLTIVTWLCVILALMLVGVGYWWTIESRSYREEADRLKLYVRAKERVAEFCVRIEPYRGFNEIYKELKGYIEDKEQDLSLDLKTVNNLFNINTVPYELLYQLMLQIDIPQAKDKAAAICAWRGDKESKLVPKAAFDYFAKGYACKGERFQSLDELELVKGFDVLDPIKIIELKQLLTVYGDGKINMNFIDEVLLKAILESIKQEAKLRFDSQKMAQLFVANRNSQNILFDQLRDVENFFKKIMDDSWSIEFQTAFRVTWSLLGLNSDKFIVDISDKNRKYNKLILQLMIDQKSGEIKYLRSSL